MLASDSVQNQKFRNWEKPKKTWTVGLPKKFRTEKAFKILKKLNQNDKNSVKTVNLKGQNRKLLNFYESWNPNYHNNTCNNSKYSNLILP